MLMQINNDTFLDNTITDICFMCVPNIIYTPLRRADQARIAVLLEEIYSHCHSQNRIVELASSGKQLSSHAVLIREQVLLLL